MVHLECPASTLDPDAVASGTVDEVYEMPSSESPPRQVLTPRPLSDGFTVPVSSNTLSTRVVNENAFQGSQLQQASPPVAGGGDRRCCGEIESNFHHSSYSSLHELSDTSEQTSLSSSRHQQQEHPEGSIRDGRTPSSGSINSDSNSTTNQ